MKTVMKFEAFDGTVFDDRKDCERHEREHARTRIVGLTAEQIAGAFNPTTDDDHGLAAALEDIGVELRAARLARGDKRRKPKADGVPDAATDDGGPKSEGGWSLSGFNQQDAAQDSGQAASSVADAA